MFLLLVLQYGGLDSVPLALLDVSICLSLLLAAVVSSFGHASAAICSNVRMNDESCSRTRPQRCVLRGDILLYPSKARVFTERLKLLRSTCSDSKTIYTVHRVTQTLTLHTPTISSDHPSPTDKTSPQRCSYWSQIVYVVIR